MKGVRHIMKKRDVIIVSVCLIVFLVAGVFELIDKKNSAPKTLEESIIYALRSDDESADNPVPKRLDSKIETNDGYICVAETLSEEKALIFGYIIVEKNGKISCKGHSMSSVELSLYNDDYEWFRRLKILNFSKTNFYYNCFPYDENISIYANGEKLPIYTFDLSFNGKDYKMGFCFVRSEKEPEVTVKNGNNV